MKILLADDDTDDCIFFRRAIQELQLSTNLITVHDGEELMSMLTDESCVLPDVLYLDLNMPRKNGFECLTEIKKSEKLNRFPVVIFSTSFEQEVVNQLYINGAQFFIRKPAEFQQFKKIIHQSLVLIRDGTVLQTTKENFVLTLHNN
jgi:CheY-like chemotaxis protein